MAHLKHTFCVTADHVTYTADAMLDEHSNDRLWFIAQQRPRCDADWDGVQCLAKCYYFAKHYKCVYNNSIQRKIEGAPPFSTSA